MALTADQEKLAAGALTTLAVWLLNRGGSGGPELGIIPEVASALTTVLSLCLNRLINVLNAIEAGVAAVWNAFIGLIVRALGAKSPAAAPVPTDPPAQP